MKTPPVLLHGGRDIRGTTSVLTPPCGGALGDTADAMSVRFNGRPRHSLLSGGKLRRFRCAAPGMYFTRLPCRLSPTDGSLQGAFDALLLSDHSVFSINM